MANIFNEVDEDIRKERYKKLWSTYGKYVVIFLVLVVIIFSLSQYLQSKKISDNKKILDTYIKGIENIEKKQIDLAVQDLEIVYSEKNKTLAAISGFKISETYLNNGQKEILRELINSIDNTPRLKEFYNSKVNEIQSELSTLNKKVKDETTKIKVNEVKNIICELDKSSKVKDDDLINLLQYYDLIDELKVANV